MILHRATVLKSNYKKGTAKCKFDDTGDVIDDLCVVCGFDGSSGMPDAKDQVLVLMDGAEGYILGCFYNGSGSKPPKGASKNKVIVGSKKKDLELKAKSIKLVTSEGEGVVSLVKVKG